MENNRIEDTFKQYLVSNGYPSEGNGVLRVKTVWTRGDPYQAVAVYMGDSVVQLFLLMSEESRKRHRHYPAYKSFRQNPSKLENVYPATYVATPYPENDSFKFFNASNAKIEVCQERILNYKTACENFNKRINARPMVKLLKRAKCISWALAGLLSMALVLYSIVTVNNGTFEFGTGIVGICGIIVFLVILPIILPKVNNVSLGLFSAGINDIDD